MVLRAKGQKELRAEVKLRYIRTQKQLSILFLGPLGDSLARLDLKGSKGIWKDGEGTLAVKDHPMASQFFDEQWSKQMDFMLGIRDPQDRDHIFLDASGNLSLWIKNNRKIKCEQQICDLSDKDISAKLDFASVTCRDSLY